MSREYKMVNPELVIHTGEAIDKRPDWATENDGSDILAIRTDNYGRLYVVGPNGDVWVDFDPENHDEIHAAARWIATYLKQE